MHSLSVVIALLLSGAGILIIALLCRIFIAALPPQLLSFAQIRGLSERIRFKQHTQSLIQADATTETSDVALACNLLRKSFFLQPICKLPELVEPIANHHLSVLNRVIAISERNGSSLTNLPIVEDLLTSRSDLMRSYFDQLKTKSMIQRKRKGKGRDSAGWALSEYSRRLSEIEEDLKTNRRSLETQLDLLFADLIKARSSSEVTYH